MHSPLIPPQSSCILLLSHLSPRAFFSHPFSVLVHSHLFPSQSSCILLLSRLSHRALVSHPFLTLNRSAPPCTYILVSLTFMLNTLSFFIATAYMHIFPSSSLVLISSFWFFSYFLFILFPFSAPFSLFIMYIFSPSRNFSSFTLVPRPLSIFFISVPFVLIPYHLFLQLFLK